MSAYKNYNFHMVCVQTKLEMQIDEAISAGDLSKAESLSEHLANREVSRS